MTPTISTALFSARSTAVAGRDPTSRPTAHQRPCTLDDVVVGGIPSASGGDLDRQVAAGKRRASRPPPARRTRGSPDRRVCGTTRQRAARGGAWPPADRSTIGRVATRTRCCRRYNQRASGPRRGAVSDRGCRRHGPATIRRGSWPGRRSATRRGDAFLEQTADHEVQRAHVRQLVALDSQGGGLGQQCRSRSVVRNRSSHSNAASRRAKTPRLALPPLSPERAPTSGRAARDACRHRRRFAARRLDVARRHRCRVVDRWRGRSSRPS